MQNRQMTSLPRVLSAFGLHEISGVEPFGNGLINHTWKISSGTKAYILQRVNHQVFEQPGNIAHNISVIAAYLEKSFPDYLFVRPLKAANGEDMVYQKDEGYFRLFPFVAGSHTKNVVSSPAEAFEAASQFGRFTKLLAGLDVRQLRVTIPSFHDLSLRYRQFTEALQNGDRQRADKSKQQISFLLDRVDIVEEYEQIKHHPAFTVRVTHHDTKISNVLFNDAGKGLCVIDLDTVMPGYFISDVGDMMRTYLSPVSEEEADPGKISVRPEFYKAIVEGYCSEMKDELTWIEKEHFFYAGKFIIYMQALRFLADYLNNDRYYGSKYLDHNLVRASNQIVLLRRLLEIEEELVAQTEASVL